MNDIIERIEKHEKKLCSVLIVDGMSNDRIVFLTDAEKKDIEEWCNIYIKSIENGENVFLNPLKDKHYVEILFDSETDIWNELYDKIKYDFVFDLQYF